MEDDRVSLLEQQLAQAKLIAEEADKKYEEVGYVDDDYRTNTRTRPLSFPPSCPQPTGGRSIRSTLMEEAKIWFSMMFIWLILVIFHEIILL